MSSIFVTIRITVRMQESEVRNPHSLDYRKSYQQIFMKFYGELGCGLETNWLHVGDDPHHYPDPRVPWSRSGKNRHVQHTQNRCHQCSPPRMAQEPSDDPDTVRIQESKVRNPDSLSKVSSGSDQSWIANLHCKNHSAILLCWRSAEVRALRVLLVKTVNTPLHRSSALVFTAQCTLVHMRGLGIACRLSVCLSVCLWRWWFVIT